MEKQKGSILTIFTPTYNREILLGNLYRSLKEQTDLDFEWLIVDDGSNDGTEEIVANWMLEKTPFTIIYYMQEHGGKHRAINKAVNYAKGDFFFIVDSDDYLFPNAVSDIKRWINTIDKDQLTNYAGIYGLCCDEKGQIIGGGGLEGEYYIDCNNFERDRYNLHGDKAEVYRTDLLREFPFPEHVNETFVSEGTIWNKFAAEGYKVRYFLKPVYYRIYREDGLTNKGMSIFYNNPRGWLDYICSFDGFLEDKEYYRQLYIYILICRLFCYEYKEYLEKKVGIETTNRLKQIVRRNAKLVYEYCKNNHIDSIAIYGAGHLGIAFFEMMKDVDISLRYGIDKNVNGKWLTCGIGKTEELYLYSPTDIIKEKADAVFITMQEKHESVYESLRDYKNIVFWCEMMYV